MEKIKEEQMIKALIDYPIKKEDIDRIKQIKELKTIRDIVTTNYKQILEREKPLRKM